MSDSKLFELVEAYRAAQRQVEELRALLGMYPVIFGGEETAEMRAAYAGHQRRLGQLEGIVRAHRAVIWAVTGVDPEDAVRGAGAVH